MGFVGLLTAVLALLLPGHPSDPGFAPMEVVRRVRQARAESALAPNQSQEDGGFLIGTAPGLGLNMAYQEDPHVASDGRVFLVVWEEERCDAAKDIWGARVSADGAVLDTCGFPICSGPQGSYAPAVAFGDSVFLVVWYDNRVSLDVDIYGARVTADGRVLDTAGFVVCDGPSEQVHPSTAWGVSCFLVTWMDYRFVPDSQPAAYAARVGSDGTVLDPAGFPLCHSRNMQSRVELSAGAGCFLALWNDSGDLLGARVSEDGAVLDSAGIPIAAYARDQEGGAVTFNGTDFLVTWYDSRRYHPDSFSMRDLYCARVTPAGVVLDSGGTLVWQRVCEGPCPSSNGSDFLVAWKDEDLGTVAVRLDASGRRIDSSLIVLSACFTGTGDPSVGWASGNWLAVWSVLPIGSDIVGRLVDSAGRVRQSAEIPVSTSAPDQYQPVVACDGSDYLVVWAEQAKDDLHLDAGDVMAARVTADGILLDSSGIVVDNCLGPVSYYPDVCFNGTDYLVTWTDDRDSPWIGVFGARVSPAGVLLDTEAFRISNGPTHEGFQSVASDGSNWLVTWTDWRPGQLVSWIYAARVSSEGAVLDSAGIPVAVGMWGQFYSEAGYDGDNYLVVWEDSRDGGSLRARRVARSGAVLDSNAIAVTPYGQWIEFEAAVTFDGENYLIAWTDNRNNANDIYASRVTRQGVVLDPPGVLVSNSAGYVRSPAVTYDGTEFIVAWLFEPHKVTRCVEGAYVNREGSVTGRFSVLSGQGQVGYVKLATVSSRPTLMTYSCWTTTAADRQYNAARIWGMLGPFSGVTEDPEYQARGNDRWATIVRGVLVLGAVGSRQNTEYRADLLDISGRKVLDLHPGPNDVSRLSPGVYFVREAQTQTQAQAIRKVVVSH